MVSSGSAVGPVEHGVPGGSPVDPMKPPEGSRFVREKPDRRRTVSGDSLFLYRRLQRPPRLVAWHGLAGQGRTAGARRGDDLLRRASSLTTQPMRETFGPLLALVDEVRRLREMILDGGGGSMTDSAQEDTR